MNWMLLVQFIILTFVICGVLIFVLWKVLFESTQGAVNRLNRETEQVRAKQTELNEKIKQASEELNKRRAEADQLVVKMKDEAEEKAKQEREKILTKARQDGEEIIAKAQKTKDDMRKVLEREMDIKAMDFTTLLLNEILSQKSLDAFHENFVMDFLDGLDKVDMSMIADEITSAEVVTALPLSEGLSKKLTDILQKKLNRTIKLNITSDPKIISGIVLRFGSLSLNGSFQSLVKKKGEELKELIDKGLLKL